MLSSTGARFASSDSCRTTPFISPVMSGPFFFGFHSHSLALPQLMNPLRLKPYVAINRRLKYRTYYAELAALAANTIKTEVEAKRYRARGLQDSDTVDSAYSMTDCRDYDGIDERIE